ncbi:MAG: cell division protein ZipA [Acidihalobacter sp.]
MHWNPAVGLPLLFIGLVVIALIWLFGQPRKPGQGRRQPAPPGERSVRREPTLGDDAGDESSASSDERPDIGDLPPREPVQASLLETPEDPAQASPPPSPTPSAPTAPASSPSMPPSSVGIRPRELPVERIVALNVVATDSGRFEGADLVVAADKAGLEFGPKGIFHRLLEGKPEQGPVFSVANMLQPGSFDLSRVAELSTTGLSFFMTLPGPIPALDAWDAMLPTAQRLAELLGGQVLDEEHNALGRQRIAHIRDELRAWDRTHQGPTVGFDS